MTRKKASGKGPYPKFIMALEEIFHERDEKSHMEQLLEMLKWRAVLVFFTLLCFFRFRGSEGLEKWIVRKISISHAWREQAARRKARLLYRESRRRRRV